jgi:peptidoglycan/xylan/chitin deacetylase (PgdA/CDA1 family)
MRRSLGLLISVAAAALISSTPALGLGNAAATPRFELQVPVLYYHRILCAPPDATIPSLYICPDQFLAQLTYLHDHGWHTITADGLADLMAARNCPDPKVFVISIDDGAVDGYDNAAPIMESLAMRGTYFVTTGKEGGLRPGKISWDQLRDLVARGHAIGDHSKTHENLKVQPADVLYDQIEVAQQIFQQQLGFRPRTFAYPYGRYNDAVIAQVAASGLELAFTVHAGAREASDASFISKRIEVLNGDTGADVLAKVEPFKDGCRPPTPDLLIGPSESGPFKGNNIHAPVAWRSQTLTRTGVHVGTKYHYSVLLQNDAQVAGNFAITRAIEGTAAMKVRYTTGGVDITSPLVAGTYVTPQMAPWSSKLIDVWVTPKVSAPSGTAIKVILRAVSSSDPSRVDVVRAVTSF